MSWELLFQIIILIVVGTIALCAIISQWNDFS